MMPSHRSRRNLFPPVVVQPNPVVIHDSPRSEVTVYSSKRSGCIAAGIVCLIAAVVFFSIPVPFFWIAGLCLSAAFIACIAASFFVDSFGSSNNGQLNISQGLDDEHHEIGLNRDIEREKESQTQEKHEKSDFDVRVPNVDKVHEI
jgi:hypothetical protein